MCRPGDAVVIVRQNCGQTIEAIDRRNSPLAKRCTEIADQAVPRYRQQEPYPSCTGHVAKQWQAAWDGACIALGGDPKEYLG